MHDPKKNNSEEDPEKRNPILWGIIYMIIGTCGLAFSVFALADTLGMVPLYGTITAGILIGSLSLLITIYGYRVFRRDY